MTRHTQRFTGCFWTLDKTLADARVFPAVSVEDSYSISAGDLAPWWHDEISPAWAAQRIEALNLLEAAARVRKTARLVGEESLPDRQRLILRIADLFEEGVLRQSAYDATDASCSPQRQVRLLAVVLEYYHRALEAIDRGVPVRALFALPIVGAIARAKSAYGDAQLQELDALRAAVGDQCDATWKAGVQAA